MKSAFAILLFISLVSTHRQQVNAEQAPNSPLRSSQHRLRKAQASSEACVRCHLVRLETNFGDKQETEEASFDAPLACVLREDEQTATFILDIQSLPTNFLGDSNAIIEEGSAHTCIPETHIDWENQSINVPEGAQLHLDQHEEQPNRLLTPKVSNQPILVVRVLGSDGAEQPAEDNTLIQSTMYTDTNSVVEQFRRISHGSLNLKPASGNSIDNGVGEISLPDSFQGGNIGVLKNKMIDATQSKYGGLNTFHHVVFCIPDGSLWNGRTTWTAFTFMNARFSIYQKSMCTRLSTVIHEMGHGMGFHHSGKSAAQPYSDQSGYMGFSYNQIGLPLMAFNGQKQWFSTWFDDGGKLELEKSELPVPRKVILKSFVDFESGTRDFPSILKVDNLFLQYNRAKGYNEGTSSETANKVTITEASSASALSFNRGSMAEGETVSNLNGLSFTVCETFVQDGVDYATVGVSIAGDGQNGCATSTPNPTTAPSRSPTRSPTRTPTLSPTRSPTKAPTHSPTRSPTKAPTRSPTRSPTKAPTLSPTRSPTKAPTRSPTRSPTKAPTRGPTHAPSTGPTHSSTRSPTMVPTKRPTQSPVVSPTRDPTMQPSRHPTLAPIRAPTRSPTLTLSKSPTLFPTKGQRVSPTSSPVSQATGSPTSSPVLPIGESTLAPFPNPSQQPSSSTEVLQQPSLRPVKSPESLSSVSPTILPTMSPVIGEEDDYSEITTNKSIDVASVSDTNANRVSSGSRKFSKASISVAIGVSMSVMLSLQ